MFFVAGCGCAMLTFWQGGLWTVCQLTGFPKCWEIQVTCLLCHAEKYKKSLLNEDQGGKCLLMDTSAKPGESLCLNWRTWKQQRESSSLVWHCFSIALSFVCYFLVQHRQQRAQWLSSDTFPDNHIQKCSIWTWFVGQPSGNQHNLSCCCAAFTSNAVFSTATRSGILNLPFLKLNL